MVLKYAMTSAGNADSTVWQAMRVFNDCNVPLVQKVILCFKRRMGEDCPFESDSTIPKFESRKVVSLHKTVQAVALYSTYKHILVVRE